MELTPALLSNDIAVASALLVMKHVLKRDVLLTISTCCAVETFKLRTPLRV